eukprot:COSAG05_NODE_14311_length_401_cov_0.539735_1_plen_52_part_01
MGQLGKIEGYRLALREERALGWRQGRAGHGPRTSSQYHSVPECQPNSSWESQ